MCEEHVHEWVLFQADAWGYFNKRGEGPDSKTAVQWYHGRALSCAAQPCSTFLFLPNNPAYGPVECEYEPETSVKAMVAA